MNTKPLMDVVVDTVMFLELSGSELVDPDAAVALLEQIASTLQELGPAERQEFLEYLKFRESQANSAAQRRALKNLACDLGLGID